MGLCDFRLELKLECPVCKQWIEDRHMLETHQIVKLFGAANRYVVCCNCQQSVADDNSLAYRRRWDRRAHWLIRNRIAELRKMGYGFNKEQTPFHARKET